MDSQGNEFPDCPFVTGFLPTRPKFSAPHPTVRHSSAAVPPGQRHRTGPSHGPEERALIEQKMAQLGTTNMAAYLRKMAIDGFVINLELPELREMVSLLALGAVETADFSCSFFFTEGRRSTRGWKRFSSLSSRGPGTQQPQRDPLHGPGLPGLPGAGQEQGH